MASNMTFVITLQLKGQNEVEKLFDEVKKPHEASVSIDTTGVQSGIENLQNPIKNMVDNIKTGFAQIGLAISGVQQVIGLVRGAIDPLIAASNVQEDAVTSLNAALRNTGLNVDKVSGQLQGYAASIQKVTRYGDEAILSGTALAQNIGKFGEDILPDVQKAAVGLAATYKIDLKTAFELLGRASKGQTSTLTRYGIVLDTTKTKEEQFAQILQMGADGFSIAKDEAESGAGALEQYKNIVGDLQESMGDLLKTVLIPVVKTLSAGITAATNFFRSLTETPLESTIRELENLGAAAEDILDLKKLMWKQQLEDVNAELKKAGVNYKDIKDVNTRIADIENEIISATLKKGNLQAGYNKKENETLEDKLAKQSELNKIASAMNVPYEYAQDVADEYYSIIIKNLTREKKELSDNADLLIQRETLEAKINQTIAERPEPEVEDIPVVSEKEIDKAREQMDAFFLSIASKRDQLEADYENKKSLLEIAYLNDPEVLRTKMQELNAWHQNEQKKLNDAELLAAEKQQNELVKLEEEKYQKAIKLIAAKKQAGLATEKELLQAQLAYSRWLKKIYGENSQQYLDSLNDNLKATEQYWRKNNKLGAAYIDTFVAGFKSMWDTILDESMTGRERLKAIWDGMKRFFVNAIGEMAADYIKAELSKIAIAETVGTVERAEIIKTEGVQKASILSTIALKIKSAMVTIGEAIAAGFKWLVSTLGPFGLAAGIALGAGIIAAFNGIRSQLGFRSGGYTGDGDKNDTAGVVHRGETVFESEITRPNLTELLGLRRLLQKGYRLKDLLLPSIQLPMVNVPIPQFAYAGGGYTGESSNDFGSVTKRLERIEKAIRDKKMDGIFELSDRRSGRERYEVHLKDKAHFERHLR
jgi:hypothetical protein